MERKDYNAQNLLYKGNYVKLQKAWDNRQKWQKAWENTSGELNIDEEWDKLEKLAGRKGKSYKNAKAFLRALKKL